MAFKGRHDETIFNGLSRGRESSVDCLKQRLCGNALVGPYVWGVFCLLGRDAGFCENLLC